MSHRRRRAKRRISSVCLDDLEVRQIIDLGISTRRSGGDGFEQRPEPIEVWPGGWQQRRETFHAVLHELLAPDAFGVDPRAGFPLSVFDYLLEGDACPGLGACAVSRVIGRNGLEACGWCRLASASAEQTRRNGVGCVNAACNHADMRSGTSRGEAGRAARPGDTSKRFDINHPGATSGSNQETDPS